MKRKRIMSFLFWGLAVYISLIAFLYVRQRNLMYFPDTNRPAIVETVQVAQTLTEDGLQLEGWYIPAQSGNPTIIYFHGNASHYGARLPKVVDYIGQGYGILLAGYRGYGGNPGSPSEQGFYKDARAWMKFLAEKNIALKNTIIYGESLGTGVAVQTATEYSAGALVLEAPFSSTVDVAQSIYFFVPVRYLMSDRFQSADKIKKVKSPILIIHGEKDATIPISFGRRLAQASEKAPVFISFEKAGHNDLYDHGAARHVLDFLSTIGLSSRSDVNRKSNH